jgi:hypothetical protein
MYQVFLGGAPCSCKFDEEKDAQTEMLRRQLHEEPVTLPTAGAVWAMNAHAMHYEVRPV